MCLINAYPYKRDIRDLIHTIRSSSYYFLCFFFKELKIKNVYGKSPVTSHGTLFCWLRIEKCDV